MINQDDKFLELYNKLNLSQKESVDSIEGVVIVNAGPGTGKTQLLSLRVANILKQTDTNPYNILCLSYSDAAARNMRERLVSMIGFEGNKVGIYTFHSLGVEIINQNPEYFFGGNIFIPIDSVGQRQIFNKIFDKLTNDNPLNSYHPTMGYTYLNTCEKYIGNLKQNGLSVNETKQILILNKQYLESIENLFANIFDTRISNTTTLELIRIFSELSSLSDINPYTKVSQSISLHYNLHNQILESLKTCLEQVQITSKTNVITKWRDKFFAKNKAGKYQFIDLLNYDKHWAFSNIYQEYQKELSHKGYYDYNDMLMEVIKALENPEFSELKFNLQERYQYILVDEFQDSSGVQIRLIENLLSTFGVDDNPNILIVGDPKQAIYKFQGAMGGNIGEFASRYHNSKIINLNINYRSSQEILDLAQKVIDLASEIEPEFRTPLKAC
jgi:DNA helicase II / ATP-dependent DNA helicase PcrA